ncbi:Os05g0164000, partial [Oryza sativa Japonica Group]
MTAAAAAAPAPGRPAAVAAQPCLCTLKKDHHSHRGADAAAASLLAKSAAGMQPSIQNPQLYELMTINSIMLQEESVD